MTLETTSIPILTPDPTPDPMPDPISSLSQEQRHAILLLSQKDFGSDSSFLNQNCFFRYLTATKWNIEAAHERIRETLAWRREYCPESIDASEIESESEFGNQFLSGFDVLKRPVYFLVPGNGMSKDYEKQLRYVVYHLEKAIALMPSNVHQMTIVIDYHNINLFNAVPLSVTRQFLNILTNHYPERLGLCIMINPSWYLSLLFNFISPLMDPATKAKIIIDNKKKILDFIHHSQIPTKYGGSFPFQYSQKPYWQALTN